MSERQNKILDMIEANISVQIEEIAERLNISRATVLREIQEIKKHVGIVYMKKTKQWKLPN
ncbi:MAG: HTH domain-containing protein [Eubacteriales bacterium]